MKIASLIVSNFPQAKLNEPLASKTTFGVGGRALAYLRVKTPEELVATVTLARAKKIPYQIIAGGSNVVFVDKLYRGLIIQYQSTVNKLHHTCHCQGLTLTVSAGAPLAGLITSAIKNGLAGLETLSGIPGTVGGAVVGNAGAYGQGISDRLIAVQVFDPNVQHRMLNIKWITKEQCKFAYRDSIFKHRNWIVLRAKFVLEKGDKKALAKKSREIIKVRNKKYAPGLCCPGSFFKNILVSKISRSALDKIDGSKIIGGKIPAGKLLEEVGAKRMRIGDIFVADFHGNLLINGGKGSYADVRKLAAKLKRKVYNKFKIKLEEEVRFIN